MSDNRAIGVFDSGLGGLTVLRAIRRILPRESTIYLGDLARVPYGSKSPETVVRYAQNSARALMDQGSIKMLVIACGTASSHALESLKETLEIPVLGTIEDGAKAAATSGGRSVAVLATSGTVDSGAFESALKKEGFKGSVQQMASPLFVPIVEEGILSGPIVEAVAQEYLGALSKDTDTVILGCTHFPALAPTLKKMMAENVNWVDCGAEATKSVERVLQSQGLQSASDHEPEHKFFVTDGAERFEQLSELFMQERVAKGEVNLIDF